MNKLKKLMLHLVNFPMNDVDLILVVIRMFCSMEHSFMKTRLVGSELHQRNSTTTKPYNKLSYSLPPRQLSCLIRIIVLCNAFYNML